MTLKIYVKIRFGHICVCFGAFFCDASTNNLFNNASFRFQKYEKMFIKKSTWGKNLAITFVYFCYGHVSLKRERTLEYRKNYKFIKSSKRNRSYLSKPFFQKTIIKQMKKSKI